MHTDSDILKIVESIIHNSGKSIPKCYHSTLIECYKLGGDLQDLISNPTFENNDINKLYWSLKQYSNSKHFCFSEDIIY